MAAAALSTIACGGEDPPMTTEPARDPVVLVDHNLWTLTDETTDPFDHRPADPYCDPAGRRVEGDVFEVNHGSNDWKLGRMLATVPDSQ